MKVYDIEITERQITAGLAAMRGDFTCKDVEAALREAGAAYVMRTADRLLQKERKAGRIVAVSSKLWRAA